MRSNRWNNLDRPMRYLISHTTSYKNSSPVSLSHNELRLTPRKTWNQVVAATDVAITPTPVNLTQRTDFYGNTVTYFSIETSHTDLTITATSDVTVFPPPQVEPAHSAQTWESCISRLDTPKVAGDLDARQFRDASAYIPHSAELRDYAALSFQKTTPLLDAAMDLTSRIYREFTYASGSTTLTTPISEVMQTRRGVCQDFAQIAIAGLRSLGLAARYVSGYLETIPPPGKARLVGADASHAWFSVYLPDHGWVDFDPTNNLRPSDRHVTVGWGRDFEDVSPVRGMSIGGGRQKMKVSVDVAPA